MKKNVFMFSKMHLQQNWSAEKLPVAGRFAKRSVVTNMFAFLKLIYEARGRNTCDNTIAVYTDFTKAFAKVPHYGLLRKVAKMRIGGCFLFQFLKKISKVCVEREGTL